MDKKSEIQITKQQDRWNSRAASWDEEISDPEHYVNFEDGYQRFLEFEKRELAKIKNAKTGIDIGCGSGVTAVILAEKVEKIYLLDIADKMLEEAKKKIPDATTLHASATNIPLPDKSIDVVVSRGIVISHLPHGLQDDFLDELKRIMKPGGKIIIDFLSNVESADFQNVSPKISFTKQKMQIELERRGFMDIIFDGENYNRVVSVSAIKK